MKKRTLRKMALTKETLRSLDDREVLDAAGGITGANPQTCNASCATDATNICTNCNNSLCVC